MSDKGEEFDDFIKSLPKPNIPFEGVEAYLLGNDQAQAVFFDLPAGAEVPPHSHCAQWGIVVEGELEFNIGGKVQVCRRGGVYHIGDGEEHRAKGLTRALGIDVFDDGNRYQPK